MGRGVKKASPPKPAGAARVPSPSKPSAGGRRPVGVPLDGMGQGAAVFTVKKLFHKGCEPSNGMAVLR